MRALNGFLLVLFVAIQLGDVWTTKRALELGGVEAVPLPRTLFERMGFWPTAILVKGAAIGVAAILTFSTSRAWIFTGMLCLAGVYVLWSNWRFIRRRS